MKTADREEIVSELCANCACDTDFPKNFLPCAVKCAGIGQASDSRQFPAAWTHQGLRPVCLLYRPKHEGKRFAPQDPFRGQMKAREFYALPRDPKTGRPVI